MGPCSVCYEHPPGRDAIIDAGREKSRCVEVLDTWSVCHARHRELPPLVMGAIIMTQSHSVRELAHHGLHWRRLGYRGALAASGHALRRHGLVDAFAAGGSHAHDTIVDVPRFWLCEPSSSAIPDVSTAMSPSQGTCAGLQALSLRTKGCEQRGLTILKVRFQREESADREVRLGSK